MAQPKTQYRDKKTNYFQMQIKGRSLIPHLDVYHWLMQCSWFQFLGLCAAMFILLNVFFTCLYLLEPNNIFNARNQSFEDTFYFSIQTFATIGYGYLTPATRWANLIAITEAFVGIFSTAVITGAAFSRLSRVNAKVLFTEKIVVNARNGVPHLQIRLANWRHNNVVEAQLRVAMLITEQTLEGETVRYPLDLPLVRSRTDHFRLTWTAMHRIDQSSPLWGADSMQHLTSLNAEFLVTFIAQDQTLGQLIHAHHNYQLQDIAWNARFADVLKIRADGVRELNYHDFHNIIELPGEIDWSTPGYEQSYPWTNKARNQQPPLAVE